MIIMGRPILSWRKIFKCVFLLAHMDARSHAADLTLWFDKLNTSAKLIIVEGPKDKDALFSCGVHNTIVVLSKKPLYAIVEAVAAQTSHAIILTDFDKKGKELYGRLKKALVSHGVKVDSFFREFLQKTSVSHVEGLKTHVQKYLKEHAA